jgi:hypothetical protein
MPSILTDADKDTVKRTVPKPGNKILAVGVARLYVAHPSTQKWTYTGLQGAAVLANDLVGHTFWLKLVDVSVRIAHPPVNTGRRITNTSSPRAAELYGTKKSMRAFITTKTVFSFTLLS